jgi:hypothetical protein
MHGHHNSRIARLVVPSNQRLVIVIPMSVDRFAIARQLSPRCPPDAIFVDKVGKDGGRSVSQVSLTIKEFATGQSIGAVTVGVDVDQLKCC